MSEVAGGGPERREGGRGRLIAFEGGEGSGKSTQAHLLAGRLGALLTHEPGGTLVGRRIRELVLDPAPAGGPLDPRAEALLMTADRAQHVAEVIRPVLAAGRDVVTDRYSGSTVAYQGHGRGLEIGELEWLSGWAAGGLEADLVILLDVAPDVASARRSTPTDRMEAELDDFHARVIAGYRALAAADPRRWAVVDGAGSIDEVAERVWAETAARLAVRQ